MAAVMLSLRNCKKSSRLLLIGASDGVCMRSLSAHVDNVNEQEVKKGANSNRSSERDPHRVLKALINTVNMLPLAAPPGLIQDRGLCPWSPVKRREFILAREEGRKAAEFFISKNPKLFPLRRPEPAWCDVIRDVDALSTEALQDAIDQRRPDAAIKMYDQLKEAGIPVDLTLQNQLLDLAAYFGVGNRPREVKEEELPIELEDILDPTEESKEKPQATSPYIEKDIRGQQLVWSSENYAEKLFESMEVKDAGTYIAMILGLLKHGESTQALEVFDEMTSKGFQGTTYLYTQLLDEVNKEGNTKTKFLRAVTLLQKLGKSSVPPNVGTLNKVLKIFYKQASDNMRRQCMVLKEMYDLKIEPSLASYHYILNSRSALVKPSNELLRAIVSHLNKRIELLEKGRSEVSNQDSSLVTNATVEQLLQVSEPDDALFFPSAMELAVSQGDVPTMKVLFNMVFFKADKWNRHVLLGDKFKVFFNGFLAKLAAEERRSAHDVMRYYAILVPNVIRPLGYVNEELFTMLNRLSSHEYIPALYKELISSSSKLSVNTCQHIFDALGRVPNIISKKFNGEPYLEVMLDLHKNMMIQNVAPKPSHIFSIITMYALCGDAESTWNSLNLLRLHGFNLLPPAVTPVLTLLQRQGYNAQVMDLCKVMVKQNVSLTQVQRLQLYKTANFTAKERLEIDNMMKDFPNTDITITDQDWELPAFSAGGKELMSQERELQA